MAKNKVKLRDEIKEELEDASTFINAKKEDFEVADAIDDKYTKHLFDKYKSGEKNKNNYFTISGILSIVFGVICIVTMIIVGIVFISTVDHLKELAANGQLNFDKKKSQVIICCIIIPIIGIFSILIGTKICKFAKLKRKELPAHAIKVMTFAVLQFFFGGLVFSFLTIIAYFMGIASDYGAIYYSRIDKGDITEKQLKNAKLYYQNDLINDKEYENLKQDILNDKNIYY